MEKPSLKRRRTDSENNGLLKGLSQYFLAPMVEEEDDKDRKEQVFSQSFPPFKYLSGGDQPAQNNNFWAPARNNDRKQVESEFWSKPWNNDLEIGEKYAEGGFGKVYRVLDGKSNVIKVVPADSRERLASAFHEAVIGLKFNHPSVVHFEKVGAGVGPNGKREVRFRMPFGRVFVDREMTLSWDQLIDVFLDAICGLRAIHRAKLLHLDIKPENMLLIDLLERIKLQLSDLGSVVPESTKMDVYGTAKYRYPFVSSANDGSLPTDVFDIYSLIVTLLKSLLSFSLQTTVKIVKTEETLLPSFKFYNVESKNWLPFDKEVLKVFPKREKRLFDALDVQLLAMSLGVPKKPITLDKLHNIIASFKTNGEHKIEPCQMDAVVQPELQKAIDNHLQGPQALQTQKAFKDSLPLHFLHNKDPQIRSMAWEFFLEK